MAITQDGWFNDTYVKMCRNLIAIDLGDTTPGVFKGALFQSAVTPDFSQSNPAYGSAPFDANEASGSGYTSGGASLTVTGFGELTAANKIGWKFDVILWADSTITAAGLLVYAPGLSNRAFILRNFQQSYATEAGDFQVTCDAQGGAWRNVLRDTA